MYYSITGCGIVLQSVNMNHIYIYFNLYDQRSVSINSNSGITWAIVLENPEFDWYYKYLSSNPNITLQIIRSNPDKEWSDKLLSDNPNITWEDVQNNPDIEWNYTRLCYNPNMTWDIISANKNKLRSIYGLSYHIDYKILLNEFGENCFTVVNGLYNNPSVPWDIIKEHGSKKTRWVFNPNITYDIVKNNPNEKWMGEDLCGNPNTSYENLIEYYKSSNILVYKPITWNPNLTWKVMVLTNKLGPIDYSLTKCERWNSSQKIQHIFRRWQAKTRVEASTLMLQSQISADVQLSVSTQLPVEIIYHVFNLTYTP